MVNATDGWLRGHQDQARKVMAALAEATRRVEQDPQAAARATQAATKIPIAQSLQAVEELQFGVRGFTAEDEQDFGRIADFLVERDLVKERPEPRTLMAQGFVPGT
jgi:NitT/TauT family transport system substrate-binding protein